MKHEAQVSRYNEWRSIVDEQEKSGLSQTEFCQKKDIVLSKFVYYKGCLRKQDKPEATLFSPVKIVKESPVASDARIVLPNGFQFFFPCHLEPVRVKQLVEALLSC